MAFIGQHGGQINGHSDASSPSRPLEFSHPASATRTSIHVDASPEAWTASEILRDAFHRSLEGDATVQTTLGDLSTQTPSNDEDVTEEEAKAQQLNAAADRELILLSLFLRFVSAPQQIENIPRASINARVAQSAISAFVDTHLKAKGTHLHARTVKLEAEQRTLVIRSYFDAFTALERAGVEPPAPLINELFANDGPAKGIQALFGGQGTNEVYFDELQVRKPLFGSQSIGS